ncbi:SsgA family sporulation/cell division regulator [Streptomyces sp. NPDC049577]|uniref:SsgA family sporulation/cell division regulator n=1 Tax=Streptomyces sp. NPDC049577 TaxID=3155153 RepID=UPI00341AD934
MHTLVERELEIELVLSPAHAVAVPARLTYRAEDPYAVHVSFHVRSQAPVRWTFARELLTTGLFRACGEGDVRVWPVRGGRRTLVCLALCSPDGEALLRAPASPVSAWLGRTMRAVPPGEERRWLRLDEMLRELLAATAGDDGRPEPGV